MKPKAPEGFLCLPCAEGKHIECYGAGQYHPCNCPCRESTARFREMLARPNPWWDTWRGDLLFAVVAIPVVIFAAFYYILESIAEGIAVVLLYPRRWF